MQGNPLSYLYSVEWPAFVVVAGIGWWQMVHDTPEDIANRKAYHERMRAASAAVVARTLPRSARAITVASEELSGRGLPNPTSGLAIEAGGERVHQDDSAPSSALSFSPGTAAPADGAARNGGDPPEQPEDEYRAILLQAAEEDPGPADEMTEYNRYLALLAVKGKAKTWRNPRGF
jgi:hypothetical protein